jgi:prevent-host-death family protein
MCADLSSRESLSSPSSSFRTIDVTHARRELARLFEQVSRGERVEITRRGSSATCVIISKTELEALERALEILSETEEVKALRQSVELLVTTAVEHEDCLAL